MSKKKSDPVNHPPHYTAGKIEAIDAIEASMSREAFLGMLKGNAMKYIFRCGLKNPDKTTEDIKKAIWYLNRYVETVEGKK